MKYIVDGIEFNADRIVNPDDRDPEIIARYSYRGYILSTMRGNFPLVMAVVFASNLEEALDLAADGEFLEPISVDAEDVDPEFHVSLGNYCNYYDTSYLGIDQFDITDIQEVEPCLF
jgi:hypothetical protein